MDIDLVGTWAEADHVDLRGRVAVVIDVLRASSVIVAALGAGATRVVAVATVDEGRACAKRLGGNQAGLGRDRVVLGGERGALRLPGYDLGNSPLEYTPEAVAGRTVILTTTNGTQAVARARAADAVLVAALTNAGAVTSWLLDRRQDVTIICAGTEGRLSLDDLFCGGLLVSQVLEPGFVRHLTDGVRLALGWHDANIGNATHVLQSCVHGQRLTSKGFIDDIGFCARIDGTDVVPVWDGEGFVPYVRGGGDDG